MVIQGLFVELVILIFEDTGLVVDALEVLDHLLREELAFWLLLNRLLAFGSTKRQFYVLGICLILRHRLKMFVELLFFLELILLSWLHVVFDDPLHLLECLNKRKVVH